ncbi:PREDICTED: uncharacterized protein LOC106813991 [Priapulus caudatus]|uniref:Uncharacterized protein LOC106813991 n=1 Tax=Priapulus caudatus TaxID=37621 RepID=A0ABM1ENG0_PRICU|nr:PREDICTED: uncharacterized protein LOC106813991 [Priapulus caudatus]
MSDDNQSQMLLSGSQAMAVPSARKRKLSSLEVDGSASSEAGSITCDNRQEQVLSTVSWEEQSLYNLSKEELITLVILRGKEINKVKEENNLLREFNFQLQKGLPSLSRDLLRTLELVKESQLTPNTACSEAQNYRVDCGVTLANTWPYLSSHVSSTYCPSAIPSQQDLPSPPVDMRKHTDRLSLGSSVISPCLPAGRTLQETNQRDDMAVNLAVNRSGGGCSSLANSDVCMNVANGFGDQLSPASTITSSMASEQMRPPVTSTRIGCSSASRSINDIANSLRIPLMAGSEGSPKPTQEDVISPTSNATSNGSTCVSPIVAQGQDDSPRDRDEEEMVELHPGVSIPARQLEYCNTAWTYTRLVRQLMVALFDRQTLASSSVMGRRPTVLKDAGAKPALDPCRRDAIINYVQSRFSNIDPTQVKQAMAQKCRELHDQYRHTLRDASGDRSVENQLPVYSGVSLLAMKNESTSLHGSDDDGLEF